MATGVSYEESIKVVWRGFWLLGAVTLVEVGIALLGNGHVITDFRLPIWIMYPAMISLSIYKAYFIVGEFMHMGHEVKDMAMSVLLPLLLLVWAIIAFLWEGSDWKDRRDLIKEKNNIGLDKKTSSIEIELKDAEDIPIGYSFTK